MPAAGEIMLSDRAWYNRAGVEQVLGSRNPEQHRRSSDSARSSNDCFFTRACRATRHLAMR
ncbi:hypothetical protein ACQPXB_28130 [Amycolatopsis sp. CA-161197]|uniref:hypothetical protein n=1 Tax=Amycolatopsis sp. CA-161197 TaxID=3239922 RepID=UPI003D929A90